MRLTRRYQGPWFTRVTLLALLGAPGQAVFAQIPDVTGAVPSCYQKATGDLRVIESTAGCRPSENPLALAAAGGDARSAIVARARSTSAVPLDALSVDTR